MSTLDSYTIKEIIKHFGKDEILSEMGYDAEFCFDSDADILEYVYDNSEWLGVDLKPEFMYMNDNEIYNRVVELIEDIKIPYNEWDKFLKGYE